MTKPAIGDFHPSLRVAMSAIELTVALGESIRTTGDERTIVNLTNRTETRPEVIRMEPVYFQGKKVGEIPVYGTEHRWRVMFGFVGDGVVHNGLGIGLKVSDEQSLIKVLGKIEQICKGFTVFFTRQKFTETALNTSHNSFF